MKKFWLPLVMIAVMLIPYIQTLSTAFPEKAEAVTTEKQVVLDEDYAKVEAFYEEKEDHLEWTIEFEKKASENERRIRLAIDEADTGIGTVTKVRGEGLASYDEKGEDLKTEKVKDQEWYYGKIYSTDVEKGTLKFQTKKLEDVTEGNLPLRVEVDEKVPVEESSKESEETSNEEEPVTETDEPSESTEESSKDSSEESSTSEENTEKSSTSSDEEVKQTDTTTEKEETEESTTETSVQGPLKVNPYSARLTGLPFARAMDDLILSPSNVADYDPYYYLDDDKDSSSYGQRVPEKKSNKPGDPVVDVKDDHQKRYPEYWTNNTTFLPDVGKIEDAVDEEGKPVKGPNYRNYDYGVTPADGNEPTHRDTSNFTSTPANTTKLWGDEKNFTNSYLDYNHAYLKKWIEPTNIPNLYELYLEVVGDSLKEDSPIDIVFVMDKSASMNTATGTYETLRGTMQESGRNRNYKRIRNPHSTNPQWLYYEVEAGTGDYQYITNGNTNYRVYKSEYDATRTRDTDMIKAVSEISTDMISNSSLDVKIGFTNFYPSTSSSTAQGRSDNSTKFYGKNDIGNIATDSVLNHDPVGGTPLFYGLEKGLDFLYTNGPNFGRENAKKVLLVMGDGAPTFYISGIRDSSTQNGGADPTTGKGPLFNFEGSMFADDETYRASFNHYNTDNNMNGTGSSSTASNLKSSAVGTIAYWNWLINLGEDKPFLNTEVYSVGMGISGDGNGYEAGRNVLKNISGYGGSRYYDADGVDELVEKLSEIMSDLVKSVNNAQLYDETGLHIEVPGFKREDSVNVEAYKIEDSGPRLWDSSIDGPSPLYDAATGSSRRITTGATLTEGENQAYKFEGITLGENEMIRINYRVQLNHGAQDGAFYPTNREAYLVNQLTNGSYDPTSVQHFANPAIRYISDDFTRSLQIKKTDKYQQGISGVYFALYPTMDEQTAEDIKELMPSSIEEWVAEREKEDTKWKFAATDSTGTAYFEDNIIDVNNIDPDTGEAFSKYFWLVEYRAPDIYQVDSTPRMFRVGEEHDTESETGEVSYFITNDSNEIFSIEDQREEKNQIYVVGELINEYRPYEFHMKKVSTFKNTPLENINFNVYELDDLPTEEIEFTDTMLRATGTSNEDGQVKFKQLNSEDPFVTTDGIYAIVETNTPEGHDIEKGYFVFEIRTELTGEDENTQYERKIELYRVNDKKDPKLVKHSFSQETENGVLVYSFDWQNEFSSKEFDLMKVDENSSPINGVVFELEKDGSATKYRAVSGYPGGDLSQEPKAEDNGKAKFYQTTINEITGIVEMSPSNPLIIEPGEYSVREIEGPPGYKVDRTVREFTLGIDGEFDFESGLGFVVSDSTLILTVTNTLNVISGEFEKIDSQTEKPLAGAEFEIRDSANNLITLDAKNDSTFSFAELPLGTYKITEVTAPDGYRKLPGYLELELSKRTEAEEDFAWGANGNILPDKVKYELGSLKITMKYYEDVEETTTSVDITNGLNVKFDASGTTPTYISFKVTNDPKHPLPSTGGQGRERYFLIAAAVIIAMGAVGAVYVFRNRKGAK